jgi:hypothetical protein
MPRLRPKRRAEVRDFDEVEARADLHFGHRWIPKGTRLSRSDPAVVADVAGLHFQLPAIPLSEVLEREREVNSDAD